MEKSAGVEAAGRHGGGSGRRVVLALGLSLARDEDGLAPRLGLDPLANAPVHARAVAQALSGFEYEEFAVPPGHADYGQLIDGLVTSPDVAVLIVHVVGHGELADGGSEKLYILGQDAMRLRQSVAGWIESIEDHPDRHRPLTLFILDVCYAGEAAVTAWHARMDVAQRRAWVLAATGPRDQAFGYRLSRALVHVLDLYRRGELRIDPSVRYIPANTVWREVETAVRELVAREEGLPQSIVTSLVPSHADLSALPFFPNPGFGETAPEEQLPPAIALLADLGVDPVHFMRRAGGAEPVQRDWREGYFSGRRDDLSRLSNWLDSERADPVVRVVTGKPGVGKSALLGMLVCAGLPDLREFTKPLWHGVADTVPGTNDRLVVVHARHMSLNDMVWSLSAQLRRLESAAPEPLLAGTSSSEQSAASFFILLQEIQQRSDRPITILIDSLDESDDPEKIIEALLYPLARRHAGPVRLLIATRKDIRVNLLLAAQNAYEILDLDTTRPSELCEDLFVYVKRLLAAAGPYTAGPMRRAGINLAKAIAERLADIGGEPADPVPDYLRLGEFLTAGVYVNHALSSTVHSALAEDAIRLGCAVPQNLPDLLEMDLQRHGDQPLLQAILTALAFAQGQGMPETVLAGVMAFDPTGQGRKVPLKALYRLLDNEARLYLSRSVEEDGTTLYRLFHRGVADWWRQSASSDDRTRLYQGLIESVQRDEHARPLWHLAAPYLQRHLPQHAADADCLDQVLEDGDYLVIADPSVLLALLAHFDEPLSEQAEANAADYEHAFTEREPISLESRRQILAMSAVLSENRPLQMTLERSMRWAVRWAVATASPPTVLGAFTMQNRPCAVTGGYFGSVEFWDVCSGKILGEPVVGRGRGLLTVSEIQAIAIFDGPEYFRVVTGGDGGIRIWNPLADELDREISNRGAVATSMAAVQIADGHRLLVGGYGGFGIWDLVAGEQIGELVGHGAWVDALATVQMKDFLYVIAGADNGRIQVWDFNSGTVFHDLIGHAGSVTALAVIHLDGHPHVVSAGKRGVVYLWDLVAGVRRLEMTDCQGDAVTSLAISDLDGRALAVTGHQSGRITLWDLTTGTCVSTFSLPAAVTGVATSSDDVILVTSADVIAALVLDVPSIGGT
ncbi:hypothetical protein IAG44_05940 [Streptomyces roseirectus]|uniref:Nephrocystin 3-like N-terminal domain-containing protein n=1 Tax=Streptomyces roseirectus TaxID=2768066 RepID=A0A7H0I8B2_9ACTN|nr:hypothetical protein [Streptomyces roseirectus]QNP69028.1 hypothetical protein IAG44_05940 [Streptomyces roseirectus]